MEHKFATGWCLRYVVVLLGLLAGVVPLVAADTEPGTPEVSAYGGVVAGIGTHWTGGGGLAYAVTARLLAVGEFSYIPGGGQKFEGLGYATKWSARALDFNGGVHYELPLRDPKVVPYVGAGVGALHQSGSATVTVAGITVSAEASATDLYFNFGGGLRYYVSDRWGMRPELKVFAGGETFMRLAVGIFYQFGK